MARLDQADRAKLGERLRIARTYAGTTQDQAAQAISVGRTTMVAIERGERQVRSEELTKLAELYGVSINSLLRETAVHVDLVGQYRRTMASASDQVPANEALKLLHHLATSVVELEGRLNKTREKQYPRERRLLDGSLDAQAEDIATELRTYLGLGLVPIPDVISLVEVELGIRIFIRGIASSIGAVYAYRKELGAFILVNAKHPEERRAWSVAHDLGHFMTQREALEACQIVNGVKPPSERFADLFAGAFLMPALAVRRHFAEVKEEKGKFTPRDLIFLARRFHVSREAMCRRLEQLGLFPAGAYDRLTRQGLSSNTEREVLGDDYRVAPERLPPRLSLLAADAYAAGLLSEGQVADFLGIDRLAARELLDELGDDIGDDGGLS